MKVEIKGGDSFSYLDFMLGPRETLVTGSGAMMGMGKGIDLKVKLAASFLSALVLKAFGKASLFLNHFENKSKENSRLMITQDYAGKMIH